MEGNVKFKPKPVCTGRLYGNLAERRTRVLLDLSKHRHSYETSEQMAKLSRFGGKVSYYTASNPDTNSGQPPRSHGKEVACMPIC